MATLRRATLGRLDGVLARITLGRLGGDFSAGRAGGGSGVNRLALSAREAGWNTVRRSPNVIAALHRAAVKAQAAAERQADTEADKPAPKAPQRAAQAIPSPTDAQIRAFVGAMQTEIGEKAVEALPLPPDVLALDYLNGDWLKPVSTDLADKRRRDNDAIAILLLSL